MKKEEEKENIKKALRERVEIVAGRKMTSPRDFAYLSMRILDKTKQYISPSTLKRFWGYLGEGKRTNPFRYTLDTLAQYIGHIDYKSFEENHTQPGTMQSDFIVNPSLQTALLQQGDEVVLMWHPDRCVTIEYEGMGLFKVKESLNSKLSVNDTFFCEQIIDGEPLILRCLIHENNSPTNYICGRINGVKFKQL